MFFILLIAVIIFSWIIFLIPEDLGIIVRCIIGSLITGAILFVPPIIIERRKIRKFYLFLNTAQKVSGTITQVKEDILRPDAGPNTRAKEFKITFSYVDLAGIKHIKHEKFSTTIDENHHVGETIEVSYKKNNPEFAYSARKIGEILFYQYR